MNKSISIVSPCGWWVCDKLMLLFIEVCGLAMGMSVHKYVRTCVHSESIPWRRRKDSGRWIPCYRTQSLRKGKRRGGARLKKEKYSSAQARWWKKKGVQQAQWQGQSKETEPELVQCPMLMLKMWKDWIKLASGMISACELSLKCWWTSYELEKLVK